MSQWILKLMPIERERNKSMTWAGDNSGRGTQNVLRSKNFGEGKELAGPAQTRGYIKLSGACKTFKFDFRDKTVLDIGSSTGGFTMYALEQGAKKVIAIEKGTNQMLPSLRADPRIELHEKTDIFDYEPVKDINVVLADISFLSLKPVLKHIRLKNADYLVMLKPQFEAKPHQLNNGIVKNETIRRDIIKHFELWLKQNNFVIVNKHDNLLKGKNGNTERFYLLRAI